MKIKVARDDNPEDIYSALKMLKDWYENPRNVRLSESTIRTRLSLLESKLAKDRYSDTLFRIQNTAGLKATPKVGARIKLVTAPKQVLVSWCASRHAAEEFYEDSRLGDSSVLLSSVNTFDVAFTWRWVYKLRINLLESVKPGSREHKILLELDPRKQLFRMYEKEVTVFNTGAPVPCTVLKVF